MSSALPFCSAPEMSLLILSAHPTHPSSPKLLPSWSGHSPISSKPSGLTRVSHCGVGQSQELFFSPVWLSLSCWDMGHPPGDPECLWGQRRVSPSQPYFSQFPVDGSRGLLFLQSQSDGTEQTLSKQGVSVWRSGHSNFWSHFHSLVLRPMKKPEISVLDGQNSPAVEGDAVRGWGCAAWRCLGAASRWEGERILRNL